MSRKIEYLNPEGAPQAQGDYSHATKVAAGSNLYFIAGQLAVDSAGHIVGVDDFKAQFHQIFSNISAVLDGLGLSFDDIVKFNTYFVHAQDIKKFMTLRKETFPKLFKTKHWPPNTILVIDRLVKEEFLLEIEVVAAT